MRPFHKELPQATRIQVVMIMEGDVILGSPFDGSPGLAVIKVDYNPIHCSNNGVHLNDSMCFPRDKEFWVRRPEVTSESQA